MPGWGREVLVLADLRGVDTHGVSNTLRVYVDGYNNGRINPRPAWRIIRETPSTANIDSDRGLGIMVDAQGDGDRNQEGQSSGRGHGDHRQRPPSGHGLLPRYDGAGTRHDRHLHDQLPALDGAHLRGRTPAGHQPYRRSRTG